MINTPIKVNRGEKRRKIYNAMVEIPEHFLNCLHGNGANCDQEIKDQIRNDCLKVMDDILVGDLEAGKSSKRAKCSTIEQDGVRSRSPVLKNSKKWRH